MTGTRYGGRQGPFLLRLFLCADVGNRARDCRGVDAGECPARNPRRARNPARGRSGRGRYRTAPWKLWGFVFFFLGVWWGGALLGERAPPPHPFGGGFPAFARGGGAPPLTL